MPKDDSERIQLAIRANGKALHAMAARLVAEALANSPKLADDRLAWAPLQRRLRLAALAASGQGKDDPPPDDAARAKLRGQALDWLKAELKAWNRVAMTVGPENRATVAKTLADWKQDADLAPHPGLRRAWTSCPRTNARHGRRSGPTWIPPSATNRRQVSEDETIRRGSVRGNSLELSRKESRPGA